MVELPCDIPLDREEIPSRARDRIDCGDACTAQRLDQIAPATWDKHREFEEWMDIVADPARAEPIRTVVRALAEAGRTAGMGLATRDDRVEFFHRWRLLRARKPPH